MSEVLEHNIGAVGAHSQVFSERRGLRFRQYCPYASCELMFTHEHSLHLLSAKRFQSQWPNDVLEPDKIVLRWHSLSQFSHQGIKKR